MSSPTDWVKSELMETSQSTLEKRQLADIPTDWVKSELMETCWRFGKYEQEPFPTDWVKSELMETTDHEYDL